MPHPNRPRPSQLHHHQTHGAEMALNLTHRAPGKDSIRLRQKVAAWDEDYLASLITAYSVRPIPLVTTGDDGGWSVILWASSGGCNRPGGIMFVEQLRRAV